MRALPLALAGMALLAGAGCRSVATTERLRQEACYDVEKKDFPKAVAKFNDLYDCHLAGEPDEEGGKAQADDKFTEKNRLLWHMERGELELVRQDAALAARHLKVAATLVDDRRTTSVTREIGTYVGNDNTREFAGRGYEHTMVDYHAALIQLAIAEQGEKRWSPFAVIPDDRSRADRWNYVAALTRRMVIDNIKYNKDNNPELRYYDDPFARLLAASVLLSFPRDLATGDDANFEFDQLKRACRIYQSNFKVFGADGAFRYETAGVPDLAVRLLAHVGKKHDPSGLSDELARLGIAANDPRVAEPFMPAGHGGVLVLNNTGIVTPTNELQLTLLVGIPWSPSVSSAEKARGIETYAFQAGFSKFWAKGPNPEVAKGWAPAISAAGEIARMVGALPPGTLMGFGIPAHRKDVPIPPTAELSVGVKNAKCQVVSDIDAYARSTLRDLQPDMVAKTITRALVKQAAAQVGGKAVGQAVGGDQGKALGMLTSIAGSIVATVTESADTRHWTLLPDRIEAAYVAVPAGTHPVSLSTPEGPVALGPVTVGEGQLVIVYARTFTPPQPNPYAK